jgi:hypothetical protein
MNRLMGLRNPILNMGNTMSVKVDYNTIPKSYREYLDLMQREGEFLTNWERWGFRTPDPVLQKHATQSTPWVYFNKTGEGETGRGHNL